MWGSLQAAEAENAPGEGPFREAKFFFGLGVRVQAFRGSGLWGSGVLEVQVSGVDGVSRFRSSRHLINKLSIEDFGILGFRVGRDDGRPRA